jgi:choice-of-anchor A domain-containing protein
MRNRVGRLMAALVLAGGVAGLAAGCGSSGNGEGSSVRVSLEDLPDAPRATVQKLTAGGRIERIDKEVEDGRVVYDVEATVGGKHVEFLVADSDGAVLATETSIDFSQLPAAVRAAAAQYFDNTASLTVSRVEEHGQTTYEITGTRNGRAAEATFDPTGKLLEA